ncbi:RHS repeat-associated core domain-containing protein [Candidatus Sumerlaeota bacterium]|nr:RHS repeat-associated core domain-containing protein [Candidatus Sumerlaeota bacterium]
MIVYIYSDTGTDSGGGGFYEYYLGTSLNDGDWHYVELDLQSRLDQFPGPAIANVTTVAFFAQDLFVDDMILSKGLLGKSYELNPGAHIGAYLGTQSGSNGGISQDPWSKWYHQYNDLGTVQAVTNAVGTQIAAAEPDCYGNYRYVSGTMPDSMGLTSKFFDSDAGLYYFNARWYDYERGRWMSPDPIGSEYYSNLYVFTHNSPSATFDPTGLCSDDDCDAEYDRCRASARSTRYNALVAEEAAYEKVIAGIDAGQALAIAECRAQPIGWRRTFCEGFILAGYGALRTLARTAHMASVAAIEANYFRQLIECKMNYNNCRGWDHEPD